MLQVCSKKEYEKVTKDFPSLQVLDIQDVKNLKRLQEVKQKNIVFNIGLFDKISDISQDVLNYMNLNFDFIVLPLEFSFMKHKLKIVLTSSKRKDFEQEWARYKYKLLEFSPNHYQGVRKLLNESALPHARTFYQIIEEGMSHQGGIFFENAALHVLGYFKKELSKIEKEQLIIQIKNAKNDVEKDHVRKTLWDYAELFQKKYLLESYFFISNISPSFFYQKYL